MAHARDGIRAAVVALLAGGSTLAGARVSDHPYNRREQLPALVVTDEGEAQRPTDEMNMASPGFKLVERTYRFIVSAEVDGANAAATRGTLLAQVEVLLANASAAHSIAGVHRIWPLSYSPADDSDSERQVLTGHQLFEALYYTTQADPSTALPV